MNAWAADQERFRLYLDAGVIPASAWEPLSDAQRIVQQANALLEQARSERELTLAQAREQGLAEGREQAGRDFAQALQALADARAAITAELRRRAS